MPPIFQPEVAAEAIVWAAEHPSGASCWVGGPTVEAILGNSLAPGDRRPLPGATSVEAQQTAEPDARGRPDNLFEPLPGDHGAHGRFGDAAAAVSLSAWARERLDLIGARAALPHGGRLAGAPQMS